MKYISFAIPCYNSAAYMDRAVESILKGGEDVEIIIVNDGSKDDTSKIAHEYEEKYPTIVRAVDKENGGHGDAVNAGLDHAEGKYFKVVDSDDWVDEEALYKILDVLKKYNAKGTFFVTGNNQEHDDLIKRAYDEGHAIGLHTYTHDYAKVYASEKAYFADLKKVSDLVEKLTGEKSYLIRFPGGSSNTVSAKYVKGLMTTLTKEVEEKGYEYFDWNCDSTDATGNNVPVSTLVANATSCSANHVTILMHDTDAKDTTVQALPKIIEYYRSQGYAFEGLTKDSIVAHHSVNN